MSAPESIIEGLWEYLKRCPLLQQYTVGVNFKKDSPDNVGIIEDSTDTVCRYLNGMTLKILHASAFLSALSFADIQRIKTSAFLEELRRWFREMSDSGVLPYLPEYFTPQEIRMDEAVLYEYEEDDKKSVYHMHITLEYFEAV